MQLNSVSFPLEPSQLNKIETATLNSKRPPQLSKLLIVVNSVALAALAGLICAVAIGNPILGHICAVILFVALPICAGICGLDILLKKKSKMEKPVSNQTLPIHSSTQTSPSGSNLANPNEEKSLSRPKGKEPLTSSDPIQPLDDILTANPISLPQVNADVPAGFFVDVLNAHGYSLNGLNVTFPPASMPAKFERTKSFVKELEAIKEKGQTMNKMKISFKNLSTEEAINSRDGNFAKIALNFANENHAGGGPGFHRDPTTGQFVYDSQSARAQEESMCQKSDLMDSLTQLPHEFRGRSYYKELFDSRTMAYTSDNHLFAVQNPKGFYDSTYLEKPQKVSFITSAAAFYGDKGEIDCKESSSVYLDAQQRIETHLLAAAHSAVTQRASNPEQPIEIILGAFGCGEFAPHGNPDEYRNAVATIYKELLPKFEGIFDQVTFAVPTFGFTFKENPAVRNHYIFLDTLCDILSH